LVGVGHQDNLLIREIVKEQIHHLTRKRADSLAEI
jgi:hypothetical protein